MPHPAEFFIKSLIIRNPTWDDARVMKEMSDWAMLSPDDKYLPFLRQKIPAPPQGFDPAVYANRTFMRYLREQGVYEIFWPRKAMQEALDILADPEKRMFVEEAILSRLDLKILAQKLNRKMGWFMTEEGMALYRHYFWNTKLLTFDQWGRFFYNRTALYEQFMGLLRADSRVSLAMMRLETAVESKTMIQRAQEIAYHTLEQVDLKPGTNQEKVKSIAILGKTVVECHEALSTSDMALKDVLKQFERFQVEHPHPSPADIRNIAPLGNYSGSGAQEREKKSDLPN